MARRTSRASVTQTGGARLAQTLRQARTARGRSGVKVGFFATATYPDRTPVTNVAAKNEFGGERTPARPFMANAFAAARPKVQQLLMSQVNPGRMIVTTKTAEMVGLLVQSEIQQSITDLRSPPNSPVTIARKRKSNPLIDTGFMRMSTTYEVLR